MSILRMQTRNPCVNKISIGRSRHSPIKKSRDFDESLEARIKKIKLKKNIPSIEFCPSRINAMNRRRYERSRFLHILYEIPDSDISHADERLTELINAITGFFRDILSYLRQIYLYLLQMCVLLCGALEINNLTYTREHTYSP